MAPGAEEHRDRQPRRPGRLHHHLQPGALGCAGQSHLLDQRQTRNARFTAAPAHLPPRAVKDPNRMRGRDTQVDSHQPSLPVHRSPIAETSPHRSSRPRRAANMTATVPRRQSPTTAPTHVLQTGPTSPGRPTSLIRGIRGQASGGNQLHEALPQRTTRRHPPDQPGCSCNPGTPSRSSAGVLYMRTARVGRKAEQVLRTSRRGRRAGTHPRPHGDRRWLARAVGIDQSSGSCLQVRGVVGRSPDALTIRRRASSPVTASSQRRSITRA